MYVAEYPIIPAGTSLAFQLAGIGKCGNQCRITRPNGFNLYMIFYTVSGSGRILYRSNEMTMGKGDVIILSNDEPYEYEPLQKGWSTCWITFTGTHIKEDISALDLDFGRMIHYDSLEPINDRFRKMMGILKSRSHTWQQQCSAQLYSLLTELSVHEPTADSTADESETDTVLDAVEYIDRNYKNDISLEELAKLSKVTPEHFCKIFRRRLNMRPFEYVARKRIQEAKQLLETTSMPIAEIGAAVGYRDKSYFGYVFKKYEKISPSQFRGVK